MTPTPESLEQTAAAMRAQNKGKPIQLRSLTKNGVWVDITSPNYILDCFDSYEYRPKPEPKRVLWSKPEHVPGPVCWIRGTGRVACWFVVGVDKVGLAVSQETILMYPDLDSYEYSTDRITWKPCETTE